jgi:hypothetical protein
MPLPIFQRTIVTQSGDVLPGASVEVRRESDNALVQLYADRAGTVLLANPTTADDDGFVQFFTESSNYRITATSSEGTVVWRYVDIGSADVRTDLAASTGAGLVGFVQTGSGAVPRTTQSKLRESVSVLDFGAVGDGVTDDTASIQAAVDYASTLGCGVLFPQGVYPISSEITIRCAADLPATPSGSEIHFAKSNPVSLYSDGQATLRATAAMDRMVRYTFDASDGDLAPFYSNVEGITFDGAGLAVDALYIEWTMHFQVSRCRFHNYTGSGIRNFGYGVAQYIHNVFKGPRGIFIESGGDSFIEHNDFFPTTGGVAAIDCGYWSGNTTISSNIFTREEATGNIYAIRLSGDYAPESNREVRHVNIVKNEFCGMTAGVFSQAFSTGARNVYQCIIADNHVTPFGAFNTGQLADLNSSEGFQIKGNYINKVGFVAATASSALRLNNCVGMDVFENKFQSLEQQAVSLIDCLRCRVNDNEFTDCGTLGQSFFVVGLSGNSQHNELKNNYFYQTNDAYAQNGVVEFSGADNNSASDNRFYQVAAPYTIVGSGSRMWRNELGSSAPTTGRYYAGDRVNATAPEIVGTAGSRYTVTGWLRLTSGVNHGLNTDWVEMRCLTGT